MGVQNLIGPKAVGTTLLLWRPLRAYPVVDIDDELGVGVPRVGSEEVLDRPDTTAEVGATWDRIDGGACLPLRDGAVSPARITVAGVLSAIAGAASGEGIRSAIDDAHEGTDIASRWNNLRLLIVAEGPVGRLKVVNNV